MMDQSRKAFGRVKGQTNFSSEDKWNPADIWMVKESEIGEISATSYGEKTIDCLKNQQHNNNAKDKMDHLLPKKLKELKCCIWSF